MPEFVLPKSCGKIPERIRVNSANTTGAQDTKPKVAFNARKQSKT
ncbi:hypothetical protein A2U01_0086229 [Trifolium medium]|uniref:Uncharacterized protein n=1 Tax=Trifolium medium TaxID=97028 RepID=A0A392TUV8_9FABA|nr:hypothetical protein [Trifolium medium]